MKQKVNLSLDKEVAEYLKKLAEEDHKPVSQWVSDVVVKEMKRAQKNTLANK